MDYSPVWLTLKLAIISTGLLLILSVPLAWWLARSTGWLKHLISVVVTLPLVLPPTVLGFYLLVAMGANGPLGQLYELMGFGTLAFSFSGLILGSMIYSLPFVVQPLQNAFEAIGHRPLEVAATLCASPVDRFFSVVVPLSAPGFLTATTLGFAHTVGEFGVVLMIGGSIPGETKVLSIAIYEHVESLEYAQAHWLSAGMLLFSFCVLLMMQLFNRRNGKNLP